MPRRKRKAQALGDNLPWERVDAPALVESEQAGFVMLEEINAGSYEFVNGQLVMKAAAAVAEADDEADSAPKPEEGRPEAEEDVCDDPPLEAPKKKKKKRRKKKKRTQAEVGEEPADVGAGGAVDAQKDADPAEKRDGEDDKILEFSPYWEEFSLHPLLQHGLARLGFERPTPIQAACVPIVAVHGRDLIAAAETGSGKTLAYGLPMLSKLLYDPPGRGAPLAALVLTPTRELALQVTDHMRQVLTPRPPATKPALQIASIVGGMSLAKQERVLSRCPEVLVCTVGRLWALVKAGMPHLSKLHEELRFLVFDEADRMVEKGHFAELRPLLTLLTKGPAVPLVDDFGTMEHSERESEGRNIADGEEAEAPKSAPKTKKRVPKFSGGAKRQTLAFSATLMVRDEVAERRRSAKRRKKKKHKGAPETRSLVERLVLDVGVRGTPAVVNITSDGADGENSGAPPAAAATAASASSSSLALPAGLRLAQISCVEEDKDLYLYYFLVRYPGRCLVFVNTIAALRRVSAMLSLLQPCAVVCTLHAGMQQRARLKHLDRFRDQVHAVLVATDVAARGLDIPSVDFVVHHGVPKTAEVFVHRSGRTARAASEGVSLSLAAPGDTEKVRKIARVLRVAGAGAGVDADGRELEAFPVDMAYIPVLRRRVVTARQMRRLQSKRETRAMDRKWALATAEAAELVLETDMIGGEGKAEEYSDAAARETRETRELDALRRRLVADLAQPILPMGTSRTFTTFAGAGADDPRTKFERAQNVDVEASRRSAVDAARAGAMRKKHKKRRRG